MIYELKKFKFIFFCSFLLSGFLLWQDVYAGTCWNGGSSGSAPWAVKNSSGTDSCEIADVNYCVGTVAAAGDTVSVPAGTCTWSDRLVTLTKAITIIGAGKDATIINSDYSVAMDWGLDPTEYVIAIVPATPSDNPAIRISGFTFNFATTSRRIMYYNTSHHTPVYDLTRVRLDHLRLHTTDPANASNALFYRYGLANGVMDNCEITGSFYMGGDAELWTTNNYQQGNASNFYFEDNLWTAELGRYEGNGAARYAFRYNTIIEPSEPGGSGNIQFLEQHGNQYNNSTGCFGAEIYGNDMTSINNVNRRLEFFRQRGGKSLIFNNKMTATQYSKMYVMEEHQDNQGSGVATSPWGQPQHVSSSYYFSNYSNSSLLIPEKNADICLGLASKGLNAPSIDACYNKTEIATGTATGGSTTTVEDDSQNFVTAGVSVGDFVVNISNAKERYYAEQARIESISSANGYTNNVLNFSNEMHSSNDSGDSYRIVSSTGGVATGGSTTTMVDSSKNFTEVGVNVGDWAINVTKDGYNYQTAAEIVSISTTVNPNDTLNFSAFNSITELGMETTSDAGDVYYIAKVTDGIAPDKDYWYSVTSFDGTTGIGCGTLASRPETCTAGVGYWATDQSCTDMTDMVGINPETPISGTLYKCTATNTWTSYYTPYEYPHPLRTEAYDTVAPASPTGLSVS